MQKCSCCGKEFPKNQRKYWRKYANSINGSAFHQTCRECEDKQKIEENKKDGLYKCFVCNKWLPAENFSYAGTEKSGTLKYIYRDGLRPICKSCKLEKSKRFRKTYDDETKLYKLLQERWLGARERSFKKNLEFNITKEYLKQLWDSQSGLCAISGIPMTFELDNGRTFKNVSLDRINPNKGYIIGNVQLVCMAVNQMKSDLSLAELYMFCNAILNNKDKK